MRIHVLAWLRSWFAVRGLASSNSGRSLPTRALSPAEERALFFDADALAQAKRRLGSDGRHWGRLLASLVLACGLLVSVPNAVHACDADNCGDETEVSLIDVVLDLLLSIFGNGEGEGNDPGEGAGL